MSLGSNWKFRNQFHVWLLVATLLCTGMEAALDISHDLGMNHPLMPASMAADMPGPFDHGDRGTVECPHCLHLAGLGVHQEAPALESVRRAGDGPHHYRLDANSFGFPTPPLRPPIRT